MKRLVRFLLLLLALLMGLSACNFPLSTFPRSGQPLYIPPAGRPGTPTPSPTPDPAALIQLGSEELVSPGLFAFQPVTVFDASGAALNLRTDGEKAELASPDQTLFFSLVSEANAESSAESCLEVILSRMDKDISDFYSQPPTAFTAAGLQGLRASFSGNLFDAPATGEVAVLAPSGRCFSLIGLAADPNASALWQEKGVFIQDKLLSTLRFLDPSTQSSCQTSTDPTYGFSPDTPIQVGNVNLYDGLSREETYLATLRGPSGEEVFFTRQNPMYNATGTIVDPWEVTYSSQTAPVLLYFDIYTWQTPLAPVGFTCEAAFPLSRP